MADIDRPDRFVKHMCVIFIKEWLARDSIVLQLVNFHIDWYSLVTWDMGRTVEELSNENQTGFITGMSWFYILSTGYGDRYYWTAWRRECRLCVMVFCASRISIGCDNHI
jgi:hypothetical protein